MLMERFHLPANSESKACVITRSKDNTGNHDREKNDQKPWWNPQSIHLSEAQASLCKNKGPEKGSMSTAHSRITTFCIVFQRNFKASFLLKNTVREIKNGISRQAWVTLVKEFQRNTVAPTGKPDSQISRLLNIRLLHSYTTGNTRLHEKLTGSYLSNSGKYS
jgi:hypothetical protein